MSTQATGAVTIPALQKMKDDGQKIVGVVAWDYQIAKIVDRAGVEIISVGDTVGINLWGQPNPFEITMDEMITVARAVRRGVTRAMVCADFPYGPLQQSLDEAKRAGIRLVKEAGVDMIKLDGAADFPEAVEALTKAGIPIFAQFGITPQTALKYGIAYADAAKPGARIPDAMMQRMIDEAKLLENAGAALLDFTNSGPVIGPEVTKAVKIPVIGGFGGGPWLDGRMRMAHAAIGYAESWIDSEAETYANVARITLDAIKEYAEDVRSARPLKGQRPKNFKA